MSTYFQSDGSIRAKTIWKRFFDLTLLAVFSPLIILVAILIVTIRTVEQILLWEMGPPVIHEIRVSQGKEFKLYKFNMFRERHRRDYMDNHETYRKSGTYRSLQILPDSLTPFGAIMKKFYLDEFPQLFNILINDMTFIGPRPQVPADSVNKMPNRKILKCGFFSFAHNNWKNNGRTILRENDDEKYLHYFQTWPFWSFVKLELLMFLDGIMATVRARGY